MRTYFTCYPKFIKENAARLAGKILENRKHGEFQTIIDIGHAAKVLYKSAVNKPRFCRSAVLIVRLVASELFWVDQELSAAFQEELTDLVTSNFVTVWTKEFNRGCDPNYEALETQVENERFNESNPCPEELVFEDMYLEEVPIQVSGRLSLRKGTTGTVPHELETSYEPDLTLKQRTAVLPLIDEDSGGEEIVHIQCNEEVLYSASILLGDLYSMGFIHPDVMQTCILYLVNNLCQPHDLSCLYDLLDRAATYFAPEFGLVFLRTCRYKVVLYGSTRLKDDADGVVKLLTLIDDIIAHDLATPRKVEGRVYSQRACHRWDKSVVGDILEG